MTLAPEGADGGYLIASVQGNNSYALFTLPDAKLAGRFRVVANSEKDIDEVTGTDGIALTVGNFGPQYPGWDLCRSGRCESWFRAELQICLVDRRSRRLRAWSQ